MQAEETYSILHLFDRIGDLLLLALSARLKETLGDSVTEVRFTNRLKNAAVCLTTEGGISLDMQRVLNAMPNGNKVKAETVLEINEEHPIAAKLADLFENDKDTLAEYAKLLYDQGCLISGAPVQNPAEFSQLISKLMVK